MLSFVFLAAADAVEEEAPNPLIPHTAEMIVGLIAFAILFFVLKKFAFPMFEKAYAERTAAIEGGIAKAEAAQQEAARALESYNAQLADGRAEAARLREEARAEAQALGDELRAQARQEAADIVTRAQAQMAAERQAVVAELRREVGTLAVDLAGKIVGQALESDARQSALIDDFIAGLETQGA